MKKVVKIFSLFVVVIALFIGLFCPTNKNTFALSEGGEAKVIVSSSYLYKTDSFEADYVSYQEEDATILVKVKYGDKVVVNNFNGDFAYITTNDNFEGYIYKYYLTDNSSQVVYPVFNASVRRETTVFDINQEETSISLKKGTRVYIYEGFNDKKEFTAVQIVLEDQSLYNGYIKTENVKPDGVSGLLIVAISIIVAAVTIIMSLLYIKKKKTKKNKE